MKRALLIGAGEVGAKHLTALTSMPGMEVAAVADPDPAVPVPPGTWRCASWQTALRRVRPDLVVVATPPGVALAAARAAASAGAVVLVEKPVAVTPEVLRTTRRQDRRVFVGFQPHFAPGLGELLADPPRVRAARVLLACRRDPAYYRGWRRTRAKAGGVLHQQAIHGLALALRLMPGKAVVTEAVVHHRRELAETEDQITAVLGLPGGRIEIDARVDAAAGYHHVLLDTEDGQLTVRGRNMQAGLGDPDSAPTDLQLRVQMYTAVLQAAAGGPAHPSLFPLKALRRPLEVIDDVYTHARAVRPAGAATPPAGDGDR
ncbi:Gfo/Idh/MocA family oxidoreductase [Streptomyces sp. SM12]|uniref:Gfo/Idh/MocA family oxidoreductase n=1 Tax=Streptomyces sp. SM12 TaxID=1071602 RepID=UPI000CD53B82|nr:Gfo/Idh/MocA family oxidoreductase [Streptomyces sp. SM12]